MFILFLYFVAWRFSFVFHSPYADILLKKYQAGDLFACFFKSASEMHRFRRIIQCR